MRQMTQAFCHRPAEGIYGDCFRTAVACILEIERDKVPHVCGAGEDGETATKRMNDWLADFGLTQLSIPFTGDSSLESVLTVCGKNGRLPEYILTGESKSGVNHCVVCKGDEIVWDPSQNKSSITGPCDDGFWWITALIVTRPTGKRKMEELDREDGIMGA